MLLAHLLPSQAGVESTARNGGGFALPAWILAIHALASREIRSVKSARKDNAETGRKFTNEIQ